MTKDEALQQLTDCHIDGLPVTHELLMAFKRLLAEQDSKPEGVKGYAMALNEVALKLRKRYEQDLLSTPLWADFEAARNKFARSIAAPQPQPKQDSEPVAQDEALKYLKAVTFGFGPDEPIQLDRETWARIHSAIKQVIAHPEQHSAPAVQPLTSAPDNYVPCCADQTCPKCVAAKSQPLTVPQDFYTHKQSWRRAIECAIEWSKGSDSDADELYFKHELKAFDRAYAELLAATPEAPAVQQEWIDPTDKTQAKFLPNIGEPVWFCYQGKTYFGKHTGGSFVTGRGVTQKQCPTWACLWVSLPKAPAAHGIKE